MKASDTVRNPYYLKDIEGGYYNKYPEFQVWEEGKQAGIKDVVELDNDITAHILQDGDGNWSIESWRLKAWFKRRQSKLKEWGI